MKIFFCVLLGIGIGVAGTLLAIAGGWFDPVRPAHPTEKDEWGRFPTKPKVELLDDGRELRLLEDFAYVDPQGRVWAAKTNSVVDGASIPRPFWAVTGGPLEGEFRNASIVHDVACDAKTEPWEDVHFMFYQACRCGQLPENKAKIIYAAVYHFGPRWDLHTVQEVRLTKDDKGNERKTLVTVHRSKLIPRPAANEETRRKLEKLVTEKNPSLEELRKLDPKKL